MERINFREFGDLGKILNKSAMFIRYNFIPIIKASSILVFIPLVIGLILLGISTSSFYSNLGISLDDPYSFTNPFGLMIMMLPSYLLISISLMMFYIIGISYMKHYVNGEENITQQTVYKDVKKHFLKVFFGGLLTIIITYIGMIFCLIPGIYLAVVFSHLFCIAIIEDKGYGNSFNRSFTIIKGQWWNSLLLYFVSTLIVAGISFIMILPMYIVMFAGMFKNIESNNPEAMFESMSYMGWFMPLYLLAYVVNILITATIQTTNYYSLVEAKEGIGEKGAIENIGE